VDARVTVHLPSGVATPAAPADVAVRGPTGARFRLAGERGEDSITMRRRIVLPVMRVTPSEYPGFARFCRAVDQAEARELSISL